MRRSILFLLLGGVLVLVAAQAATAAISLTRAQLKSGELRVEGQGAQSAATITIDGVAMGKASSTGTFSIRRTGFSSSSCKITVSDGTSSAQATLSGCTPSVSPPTPPPPPPPPPPGSPPPPLPPPRRHHRRHRRLRRASRRRHRSARPTLPASASRSPSA